MEEQRRIKAQAEADKNAAIQKGVSADTRDLLLRYGTQAAMSGAAVGSPLSMVK